MGSLSELTMPSVRSAVQSSGDALLQPSQRPGFSLSDLAQPEQSLFDVTVGAAEYGSADVVRALSARAARFSHEDLGGFGAQPFENTAQTLKQFQQDHPQYAPTQVAGAWDLVTNPKALLSHFSAGAPFMLALGGLSEIPFAGVPLAAALAYGVESQNAYDAAIASGADEQQAGVIGNITGVINAGLQLAQVNRLFKIPHIGFGDAGSEMVKGVVSSTLTASKVLGLSWAATKNFAIVGLENALQGAVREAVPSQILGKPIPSGFLERRIGEAIDAGVAGEVFGIVRNARDVAFGKAPVTTPQGDAANGQLDVFTRQDLNNKLMNDFKLPENRVQHLMTVMDAFASRWAWQEKKSTNEFWPSVFAHDAPDDSVHEVLNQADTLARSASLNNTKGFYSKLRQAIVEGLPPQGEISVKDLEGFLRNPQRGIKADEVVWTGLADAINSIAPAQRASTKFTVPELLQLLDRNEITLQTYTKSDKEVRAAQQRYDDIVDQQAQIERQAIVAIQKAKTPQEKEQVGFQARQQLDALNQVQEQARQELYLREPAYVESQTPGDATNFRNLLVRFPFTEGDVPGAKPRNAFSDPHWPGIPNVILDMHLDERQVEVPGGKEKYLATGEGPVYEQTTHVGDIQSKIHQRGSEEGYQERGQSNKEFSVVSVSRDGGEPQFEVRKGDQIVHTFADEAAASALVEQLNGAGGLGSEAQRSGASELGAETKPPAAPAKRTQDWVRLAAKFHLNEALENGSDRISWDTGDMRASAWPGLTDKTKTMYDKTVPETYLKYARSLDPNAKIEVVKVGEAPGSWKDFTPDQLETSASRYPAFVREAAHEAAEGMRNNEFDGIGAVEMMSRVRTIGAALAEEIGNKASPRIQDILAPSIKITDMMRAKLEKGQTLFQSNKASVKILKDARAVIEALNNPDASSALEELFHVSERWLVNGDDRLAAEQALGIKDHEWNTNARERFAKMFLQYMREGRAPASGKLQDVFTNIKNWMKELYPSIAKDARIDGGAFKLNDELRGIFDRMYVEDTDPVKAKRLEIQTLNQRLEALGEKPLTSTSLDSLLSERRRLLEVLDKFEHPLTREEAVAEGDPGLEGQVPYNEEAQPIRDKLYDINGKIADIQLGITPQTTQPGQPSAETPESARAEILSGVSNADNGGGTESRVQTNVPDEERQGSAAAGSAGKGTAASESSNAVERARIKRELRLRRAELHDLQLSVFRPGEPSPAAKRASEANFLPGALSTENLRESKLRNAVSSFVTPLRRLANMTAGVLGLPGGDETIKRLVNMDTYRSTKSGLFNQKIKEVYNKLSGKDIDWLMSRTKNEDGNYFSNVRRLLDPAGVIEPVSAPNAAIQDFADLHKSINDEATRSQIAEGVLRKLKSDATVTARRSTVERMPRMITEEAYRAMLQGSGRLYDSIIDHFWAANREENPGLKRIDVDKDIQRFYGRNATKRLGQLEYSRLLKIVPDAIDFDGIEKTLFHYEPYHVLSTSVDRQFGRIGFVREFGQGVVKDVGNALIRRVLDVFGVPIERATKQHVLDKLDQAGYLSPGMEKLSLTALKDIAQRQPDVQVTEGRDSLMAKVLLLSARDVIEEQQIGAKPKAEARAKLKALKSLAIKIRGVDPGQEPSALLDSIKQRVQEHVQDRLYDTLRNSFGKQGGNLDYFDSMMQLAQGMPFKPMPKNLYTQSLKFVSHIIGAVQTSTSAAPNIVQTASLVPAFTGARNYAEALRTYLASPTESSATIAGMGALKYDVLARASEPGYSMQAWGKWLQQAFSHVTGLQRLDMQNNTVSGEAFRLLAEDWRSNGIGKMDQGTVRFLRLNDQDVQKINTGKMDQDLVAKIVQNGVSGTQFRTEPSWRKGLLENVPLARILFSYNSYSNGVARTAGKIMGEWKSGFASKDPVALAGMLKTTIYAIAGTAGAGMASVILRQALKGQLTQQVGKVDDSMLQKAGAGLFEAGLFGATQRMLEPFSVDRGVFERGIVGIMPQVTAVSNLLQAIIGGYGKFGRFDVGRRVWEATKDDAPAVKGISNWIESWAYPDLAEYNSAMSTMRKYEKEKQTQKAQDTGVHEQNPDYYGTHLALARNDVHDAIDKAQEFYAKIPEMIQQSPEAGVTVQRIMQNFRASLVQRAPLNLRDINEVQFLSRLSPQRRERLLQTHQRYMALVNTIAPRQSQD